MKRREILILSLLLFSSIIAIFLPDTQAFKYVVDESKLLQEISKEGRYISTDEVAKMIMENDPSLLLIDVRKADEYKKYTLNGAINIPFDSILNDKYIDYLDQNVYTTVIFSNGSSLADQAWLILKSYNYEGNKVMKGGLNEWYKTILNPQKPKDENLTQELQRQYLFRKSAQIFFTGALPTNKVSNTQIKKPTKPIVKRKKEEVSGGCG